MLLFLAAVLAATVVASEPTASGAGSHGVIAGTITLTDARGETQAAPGVQLTLTCAATHDAALAATSDDHGTFRFADVPPERCVVTADLQGFAPATKAVVVRTAEELSLKIHLDLAPVDTGLQVDGQSTCSWHKRRFN